MAHLQGISENATGRKKRRKSVIGKLQGAHDSTTGIIDMEIVWYGSMNFLGKEDSEDNLMRICSKEIASELLELTFDQQKYEGTTM